MADLALDIWLTAHDSFSSTFEKMGIELDGMRGKIGLAAGAFGVLAGGALAESVKQASDYQSMLQHVAANTTMTTAGIKEMDRAIQDMASHSSAHMDDLAQAWMHVTDLGFTRAADAQKVVQAAMESALSTGGSVVDTANVLANAMHEFSIKATDAGHAMDVLHLASAEGNTTLEQFVEGAGRAIGMAANLGVSLTDAGAAISALTRHGFDASTASTQLIGMLEHLTNPAKAARDEIAYLSHITGVDLVHDFSQAGLQAKGLSGVLADIQKATHGNSAEIEKLIPALRGGLGAMTLTGTGAADFTQILRDLNDTMAGKTNPTAAAYARTQATLSFQIGVLKNNLQEMAIAIGSAVLPILTKLTAAVIPVVQGIATWIKHHAGLVAGLLAGVAVVGTLIGALLVLGPIIAAIASPIGIVVVAIGAAIAGIVALAASSEEVRNILAGVWSAIADAAGALWQGLTGIWNGISGDAMLLWENLGSWLSQTWTGIVSFAAPIWNGLVNAFKYVWGRITGDKDGATAALKAIPVEWRPLVQAIGDTLSGSWFTVKYLWDDITGNHAAATADLRNIPPEWRPLVKAIGDTLSGSFMTVKYLWDDITGDHKKATNDLKGIPKEWQPLVKDIAKAFEGAKKDILAFWHAAGDMGKKIWNDTIKPTWDAMSKDWHKFLKDMAPLVGPALDNVKKALAIASAPFLIAMGAITGGLAGAWKGFWSGDGKGGMKQLLLDGLHGLGNVIRDSAHIVEDAILFIFSLAGLNWDKAGKYLKDAAVTFLRLLKDAFSSSDKMMVDAWHGLIGALEGGFKGFLEGAVEWGRALVRNLGKGVQQVAHELYEKVRDALGPIGKLFPKSPAEEGPLSVPPDFRYIGDAMRHAIPHVRSAATDLMGAAGLGAGSLGIDVGGAGGLPGAAAAGGAAGTFHAGHTVTIAPNITIQGGTFTDRQGIVDLAHKVSEEIMHSVRMQGGLLPQM